MDNILSQTSKKLQKLHHHFFTLRSHFSRVQFNLLATLLIFASLLTSLYFTVSELILSKVFALNDTTKTWTFNTANTDDYTYDPNFVTIDDSGAYPTSGVNKLTNPDFSSDNSSWSILPVTGSTTPAGYIPVPGNSTFTSDGDDKTFLVMVYEAKYDCTDDGDGDTAAACDAASYGGAGLDYRDIASFDTSKVVSTANGAPIVYITQLQALSSCPSGYHLISEAEFMTIARNAEAQASNWADGTVGSLITAGGGLFRGNVGLTSSVDYDASTDPDYGTNRDTKAKFTLSNGAEIWDMSGNVYELTSDIQLSEIKTTGGWVEWNSATIADGARDLHGPSNASYLSAHGMGYVYGGAINAVIRRGGSWASIHLSGVYALNLLYNTKYPYYSTGFRCTSDPVDLSHSYSSSLGHAAAGGDQITVGSISDAKVTQPVNVGDTSTYDLSAYVYDNTIGSEGGTVSSSIAQLYVNGSIITTTYTDAGSGWWKLSGSVTGANESRNYGILVKSGKTVILDDFTLAKNGTYSVFNISAISSAILTTWDSFTESVTTSGNASVVYQLCTDDGSTCESGNSWQYWDGDSWETASNITTHTNTAVELDQTAMQSLSVVSQKISVKAILGFDGTDIPYLESISLGLTTDITAPTISLTAYPDTTTDTTPAFSGTATEDIDTVSIVEFQMDSTSGSWTTCTADDGTFGEISEAFTCTVSTALSDGAHTVYVRSTDSNSNTTASGSESSDSFTVDVTAPASIDLDSPGNNSYTNNERPTFKWKTTTDAAGGLSKYVLEIDNPSLGSDNPVGDFTIDDIPTSRTTDYETDKYVIHYENFSDSDTDNNYISVQTKSSSDWSTDSNSGQNDGKLREGIVTWKVRALDNVDNETSVSRTLFVDTTSPSIELTQFNNTSFSSNSFATTDKTPTILGRIEDSLSGDSSSRTQDENGPKVASGPKQVEVKIEKKEGLVYKLHTLYTINMDLAWYNCDDNEVIDNSKQKCDKYSPFKYTSENSLELGTYKITLTGKDNVDNNAPEKSFTLKITTPTQVVIPEEKEIIEEKIKDLSKEEQEKTIELLEITKPIEPNLIEKIGGKIAQTVKSTLASIGNITSDVFKGAGQGIKLASNTIGQAFTSVIQAIGNRYKQLASRPEIVGRILTASSEWVSNTGNATAQNINSTKKRITNTTFDVGKKIQNISDVVGLAIIKFTYNFVNEPTTISNVQVAILSPTTAKISWETNHPTNGKVNYGLNKTYPFDVQSEKRVNLHEFVLTDLSPDTVYQFEVMSHNKNYVYDANREFKTPLLDNDSE